MSVFADNGVIVGMEETHAVVAAMCTAQLGSQNDARDEGKDRGEAVEDEQDDGDGDGLDKGCGHAEEPDEPAEGCREHGVVGGCIAVGLACEHVADEGCDEQDEDELGGADDDLSDLHFCGWCGIRCVGGARGS